MMTPSTAARDTARTPSRLKRLAVFVLGKDAKQRHRATMVLMTAIMYMVCLALLGYGVVFGLFEPGPSKVLAFLCASTGIVYFTIIRSGLNLRLSEPSLAFPQAITAQTLISIAYAISGPAHAANLLFLAMVMFFGMFDMSRRNVRLLLLYTIGLMGAVMAWCAHVDPVMYSPTLELVYFAMTATVLPVISTLSVQLSTMRQRLRSQKAELETALAHIQRVATHDELTGLFNRRHMRTRLAEEIAVHARTGESFTVVLADIDHFKQVNDTYGHGVGDEALICFARQAQSQLRGTDVLARWGGEEFLILFPSAPPGDPVIAVQRLRNALAEANVSPNAPSLRIAFSAGLTRYIGGESIDEMIERADRGLYEAKRSGRNRTVSL